MQTRYNSIDEVPKHIKDELAKYITNVGGDTFVLHGLPPEMTGGLMARYSRAKTGLQLTLVNEFFDEDGRPNSVKGSELMDRVLNAFGDESVGELEGAHVGIEEISQLLTKYIEDRRIGGSPIEQSTRYVVYDQKDRIGRWRYLRPNEIMESGLGEKFEKITDTAFEVYSEGIKKLVEYFRQEFPRDEFQIGVERNGEKVKMRERELELDDEIRAFRQAYNFTIRCAALDVGRCVLPASTLTHIGIFGNGRFFTNLITHLKTSELGEANERACRLEQELGKVIPTYIKRNRINENLSDVNREMNTYTRELFNGIVPESDKVTLVSQADYIDEVVTSILFPYTNISSQQILDAVVKLPSDEKMEILEKYIGDRETRRDRTGRGLEAGYPITFDLVGGFAEYRDLERHRMLTQQRQNLTTELGFIMPPEMRVIGLENEVEGVEGVFADLNSDLKHAGINEASQYATLFNHRIRFMMGMNLREFQHLSELRTQPVGHFSYRSMVMEMAEKLIERDPWARTALGFIDYSDPDNRITRANEQSRIAGKNLATGVTSVDY